MSRQAARVLVVNAGSSSVKLALVIEGRADWSVDEPVADDRSLGPALDRALETAGPFELFAHRIVHGGTRLTASALVDDRVLADLRAAKELAPLHAGRALDALDQLRARAPDTPHVACLDSAFHSTLPAASSTYAVPEEWRTRFGFHRLGFHGFSHAYAARRAAELIDASPADLRVVTCHLGAGASVAAVQGGRSVDTTMGFTPNEGVVMATRSGSIDAGALLWLINRGDVAPEEAEHLLEHEAGLRGLAGTGDMRELLSRAAAGEARARTALDVYLHRLRAAIAAMAAAMDGLDVLVFTGGVGERSPEIRQGACDGLGFLGVAIDPVRDTEANEDDRVSADDSSVAVLRVSAREDLELAAEALRVIGPG